MGRRQNELSVTEAARRLEVHRKTVLNWCHRTIAGEDAPIKQCRQDVTGHYWLDARDLDRIRPPRFEDFF